MHRDRPAVSDNAFSDQSASSFLSKWISENNWADSRGDVPDDDWADHAGHSFRHLKDSMLRSLNTVFSSSGSP